MDDSESLPELFGDSGEDWLANSDWDTMMAEFAEFVGIVTSWPETVIPLSSTIGAPSSQTQSTPFQLRTECSAAEGSGAQRDEGNTSSRTFSANLSIQNQQSVILNEVYKTFRYRPCVQD